MTFQSVRVGFRSDSEPARLFRRQEPPGKSSSAPENRASAFDMLQTRRPAALRGKSYAAAKRETQRRRERGDFALGGEMGVAWQKAMAGGQSQTGEAGIGKP